MNAKVRCPACRALSSLEGYAPGSSFACACGNKLPVPSGLRAKPFGWGWLPFIAGGIALQFGIAGLVMNARPKVPRVPGLSLEDWRPATATIRANLRDLCDRERDHHAKTGRWRPIAPTPPLIPTTSVTPADPGFAALGFEPNAGPWQIFVVVTPERATCVARANLDATGVPYTVAVANTGKDTLDVESADTPPEDRSD